MPNKYPFAVRLIGFSDAETDKLSLALHAEQGRGYSYIHLLDDNLQDPDLFLVNADELRALARLSYVQPSDVRPALLIGAPAIDLPYACLPRPIQLKRLFDELDGLIEKRADALSRLEASGVIKVAERRRRERLDIDLTDPTVYRQMRRVPIDGGVLVVDKSAMVADYLKGVLSRHGVAVAWVNDETAAVNHCGRNKVSIVLINTSTPNIDPYRLCQTIKRSNSVQKTSVIMLTGKPFIYDAMRARCAGCDGFLNKPLAPHHLLTALKKFLPSTTQGQAA